MTEEKDKKPEKKPLLDKVYEKAKEDLVLIPLTWRVWIAIGMAVYIFGGLVLYPISCVLKSGRQFFTEDLMMIGFGVAGALVCVIAARRASKHKRGENWNKWIRNKKSS